MEIRTGQRAIRIPFGIREPIGPVLIRVCVSLTITAAAYLVSQYAARHPQWAEAYTQVLLRISRPVSSAIGILPFSFSEFWLAAMLLGIPALFVWRLVRKQPLRALAGLLATASVLYALFAAGWGVAYSRMPYADTAGLDVRPRSVSALESMCMDLAASANALRAELGEDEQGIHQASLSGRDMLKQIQPAYENAALNYPWLSGSYGNPKPVLLSVPMSYLQISGIYIPFTFEANVNMNNNSFMIPVTAAHEAAHLRGWAREDEANYIAYLICRESGDTGFMYSGAFLALIHATNALYSADSEAYRRVADTYSDGLMRDMRAHSEHWKQYEGKVSEVQDQINDAYLRANRQEDGVRSYGRMVDLMLAEYGME